MYRLVLVAFVASSAFAFQDLVQYPAALKSMVNVNFHGSGLARLKRELRKRPLADPDNRIQNCAKDFAKNLLSATGKEDMMSKLCSYPLESCYQECPASLLRTLALDSIPLMKIPCLSQDPDKAEILQCLNRTASKISAECDRVCNGATNGQTIKFDLSMSPPSATYETDKNKVKKVLRDACKSVAPCECRDNMQKQMCGSNAPDVQRLMTVPALKGATNMYTHVNVLDGPVEECKSIL